MDQNAYGLSYVQAKKYVARVTGSQTSDIWLDVAGDAIREAMAKWNAAHDWTFLLQSQSITLTADASDYATPGRMNRMYSVVVNEGSAHPWTLGYVPLRDVHRMGLDLTTQSGESTHYTLFDDTDFDANTLAGQRGKIRLFPTPNSSVTNLRFYYYARMQFPFEDTDLIDIKDDYVYDLLREARYQFLLVKDGDNARLAGLKREAEDGLQRCIEHDQYGTEDQQIRLVSQMEAAPFGAGGGVASTVTSVGGTGSDMFDDVP